MAYTADEDWTPATYMTDPEGGRTPPTAPPTASISRTSEPIASQAAAASLPRAVRERLWRNEEFESHLEILAWSPVARKYRCCAKWRADCADGCYFAEQCIIPCCWCCLLKDCCKACGTTVCCGGYTQSGKDHAVVTTLGMHVVNPGVYLADERDGAIGRAPFSILDRVVVNNPAPCVSCCRSCCCVDHVPHIAFYDEREVVDHWFGKPMLTLNGYENFEWLVDEIKKAKEASRTNPKIALFPASVIEKPQFCSRKGRGEKSTKATIAAMEAARGSESGDTPMHARLADLMRCHEDGLIDDKEYRRKREDILSSV